MSDLLINKTREYIATCYDSSLQFHNIVHAEQVMSTAIKLAKTERLGKDEILNLKLASLFHDAAYSKDPKKHEILSANLAKKFLTEQAFDKSAIAQIENLILATKRETAPTNISEMIIKDADLAHLGSPDYDKITEDLRIEREGLFGKNISKDDWVSENVKFLQAHRFYTSAANDKFSKQRNANLKDLHKDQKTQLKEVKKGSPDRGIETMFRVALRNNIGLSRIADNKANIMLSVTTIMLSIIFSTLVPKISTNLLLLVPTILTVLVCLTTMYYAILATRPKVSKSNFTREQLLQNKTNLLFFGNFHDISLDDFEWGMDTMMKDKDLVYGALKRDLYFLGLVLSKKYGFLRTCYNIFMVGMIISSISFLLVYIV